MFFFDCDCDIELRRDLDSNVKTIMMIHQMRTMYNTSSSTRSGAKNDKEYGVSRGVVYGVTFVLNIDFPKTPRHTPPDVPLVAAHRTVSLWKR